VIYGADGPNIGGQAAFVVDRNIDSWRLISGVHRSDIALVCIVHGMKQLYARGTEVSRTRSVSTVQRAF